MPAPPRISMTCLRCRIQERTTEVSVWNLTSLFKRCVPSSRASWTSIARHSPTYASSCVACSIFFLVLKFLRSLQHPFPYFGLRPPSGYPDALTQIAEQVTADHPNTGVHVWDLENALNRSLTIDRLHPTVQGHVALGEALAGLMRPLIASTHTVAV